MIPTYFLTSLINFDDMHIISKYITALVTATGMISDLGVKSQNLEVIFYNDFRLQFIVVFFFIYGMFKNVLHSLIVSIVWFVIKYYNPNDHRLEPNKKPSEN